MEINKKYSILFQVVHKLGENNYGDVYQQPTSLLSIHANADMEFAFCLVENPTGEKPKRAKQWYATPQDALTASELLELMSKIDTGTPEEIMEILGKHGKLVVTLENRNYYISFKPEHRDIVYEENSSSLVTALRNICTPAFFVGKEKYLI